MYLWLWFLLYPTPHPRHPLTFPFFTSITNNCNRQRNLFFLFLFQLRKLPITKYRKQNPKSKQITVYKKLRMFSNKTITNIKFLIFEKTLFIKNN